MSVQYPTSGYYVTIAVLLPGYNEPRLIIMLGIYWNTILK
jgi:hypothetical protein